MKAFLRSLAAAFGMLLAIPVPGLKRIELDEFDMARSTAWYPLVGLVIGLLSAGLCAGLVRLDLSREIAALLVAALPFLLTRFLHFDGLCDVFDAFLAAKDPQRTREIMHDSRVGAFALGVGAFYLFARIFLLFEWMRFELSLLDFALFFGISRMFVVVLAACSTSAPDSKLGAAIAGRIPLAAVLTAIATCLIACGVSGALEAQGSDFPRVVLAFGIAVLCALVAILLLRAWSYKKIDGVNGDVLGAGIEISELVLIATFLGVATWRI